MRKARWLFLFAALPVAGPLASVFADDPSTVYLKGLVAERFGRPSDALGFYERAAALDPSSLFLQTTLADLCLRLGRLDDSLRAAARAVAVAEKDPAVYVLIGRVRLARGEKSEADKSFAKALSLDPADGEALLYAAYLHASDDPSGAIAFLERYLQENPGSPDALIHIAQLQESRRDFVAAEATWRKAVEQDPNNPNIHSALGRLAEDRGDRDAAVAEYEAARILTPNDPAILVPLGDVLYRMNRRDEARDVMQSVLKTDPANSSAHFGLAMMAEDEKDWARAAGHMAVAASGSELPAVQIQLAFEQSMAGLPSDALKTLQRLNRREPGNADVLLYLGLAYEDLKKPRSALRAFRQVLALDPNRAEAHFHAGVDLDELGRFDDAVPHLLKAIELGPKDAAALNYLGYSWAERGVRLEDAVGLIRRALAVEPDNPAFLDSLGWCLFKMGLLAESDAVFERTVQPAQDAVVWEHAGDVVNALGRPEDASRDWEEGLLLDPKSRSLRKRLGPRAGGRPVPLAPKTAARAALKRVEGNFRPLRGAAGAVTVTVRRGPVSVDAQGIFYYRRPGDFRLEILGAFGVPEALVIRTTDGVHVFPSGTENLAPPESQVWWEALGDVLSGGMTAKFDDASVLVQRKRSTLFYRGAAGTLEIDGRTKLLSGFSSPDLTLRFEDYREVDGVWWPGVIRLEAPRRKISVKLVFRSPRLDPPLDGSLFQVPKERP